MMLTSVTHSDRFLLGGAIVALGGIGALSFGATAVGDPLSGWSDGRYQRGYESRFEAQLPTANAATELWAALRLGLLSEVAEGAVLGRDGWLFTAEEFVPPNQTRDLGQELDQVGQRLAAQGIALIPVLVPDKARVMEHKLNRSRSAPFARRYDVALELIHAQGLQAIDLRPTLSALQTPFMRTDTHWSPAGAQSTAIQVAAAVAGQDLALSIMQIDASSGPAAPFDGDLTAFAKTGRWASLVGPASEYIDTYETQVTADGGLFGDANIDVVLVGTSFSARSAFHFEGFLKRALNTDVLNLSAVGQGPFAPMDAALAAIDDLPRSPRVVIWEIPERYLSPIAVSLPSREG